MAIFRGNGGSVEGITEADILLITIPQGGTGATTASGARTNLGLGTAATTDASAYATAAQGTLADSAVQPGDLATVATSGDYDDLTNKPTIPTDLNSLTDVVITSPTTNQTLQYNGTNWVNATGGGSGTVTSVDMTVPTGLAVSGNPVTTSGTLAVTYASGYSIPTTTKQTEWDTAYTDRLKWDGGSTGLTASTGRTSLGATTLGGNLFTITDPSAVTFPRFNADNTVSALSASDFRSAIGAGTSSTTGTVTSVSGTGTVNGLTLTGTVTSSGSITLGGTLDLSSPPAIGGTTPAAGTFTNLKVGSSSILGNANADITLGLAVRNSGASMGYHQTYNSNAGTDLKTWRWGGNSSGEWVLEKVNDAYSSSTQRFKVDTSGNVTATSFIGDGSSLTGVSGGQYFGSSAVKAIAYNSNTIAENVTVTTGNNGLSAGPITISSGYAVTVQSGSVWTIV